MASEDRILEDLKKDFLGDFENLEEAMQNNVSDIDPKKIKTVVPEKS